jgi:hypothetical protein
MKDNTYQFATVCYFHIKADTDLLDRFHKWLKEQEISPAFIRFSGAGEWAGAFYNGDMRRIHHWLVEQKVKGDIFCG